MVSSFVITGFLGVGKTTMLINSIKKHFENKKVALIVNEFGEIGIDGNILKNVHSEVLEISEGCICCQLASEFESGVTEIIDKYNPEMIIVETSGASEPFPIFLSLQNLGISVEGVICVVDSKNFHSYKENSTAKYQIGGSNIIVLNKTDLVDEEELDSLEKEIRDIKEEYNIKNTLTGETVFNSFLIQKATKGIVAKDLFEGIYEMKDLVEFAKDNQHFDHTTKDSLSQKALYFKKEVTFSDIDKLLRNLPKNIYRVKGIVKTTDVPNPLVVNYTFGDSTFEDMEQYYNNSILIFIGEDIDNTIAQLEEEFDFLNLPKFRISQS